MKQHVRAPLDHLIGSVLLGRYRVVRELAKGGMGVVYLARAEGAVGFVKPVVIKLLLPEHAQDERFVGMFVREAKILSQLRHPSLVDVIEFGEQDGAYVLVIEYVRGYHLGQWLRFLAMKKRQPPPEILIQVMIDVLEALHHAHELAHPDGSSMQIVHRDVSPSNILLDEDGRARLLDFGVARMRGGSHDYKTQVNGFMGKMPYTAPEMFSNSEASPKSDLYSCGVVLHEALLGRNVFRAEAQAATLHRVMNYVPEPIEPLNPYVPRGLDAVLLKALAKPPGERPADAREFALALRRLQEEQESDVRARLANLLKEDFGSEMADRLNLESLAHRDEAWRRLSAAPNRRESPARAKPQRNTLGGMAAPEGLPAAPVAIGATVADSPAARAGRSGAPNSVPPPAAANETIEAPTAAPSPAPTPAKPAREPTVRQRMPPQAQESSAAAASPPPPPSAARAPATSSRGLMIALGVVAGLAVTAIALQLTRPPAPPPPAAAPPIRVVASPTPPPPSEPPTLPQEPEEPQVEQTKAPTKVRRSPNAQSLTLAMRRQQSKLEACFSKNSVAVEGQPTTQLEFELEASGKLKSVSLSPRELTGTALGACLLAVGRSTNFPPQPHAVSFAIPLTARRVP